MMHRPVSNSTFLYLLLINLFFSTFLVAQENPGKTLWTANWSPDGQYIAVGGEDQVLRIFSGKTFKLLKTYPLQESIMRLRWHPKKNILAVAASGMGSRLIDLDNDQTITFKGAKNLGGRAIAWNRNGKLLAIADYDSKLSIWNHKGKLLRVIKKANTKSYVAVDWHPTKDEVIALSEYIRQYDKKGQLLNKIAHRKEKVLMLCVKWHPSGFFFVIGDYGDYDYHYPALLQFWNPNGRIQKEVKLSKAEYRNISWNQDGSLLATASDALRIWSKEGNLLAEGLSEDLLWGIDWSPDGQYIVTSSGKGKIKIWDKEAILIKELVY